jgi:hypothetical protein
MSLKEAIAQRLKEPIDEDVQANRLRQLGQAGLFDIKRIQYVRRLLAKDPTKWNQTERALMGSTFHELLNTVIDNQQLFQKTKSSIAEEIVEAELEESIVDDIHHRVNMLKMHGKEIAKGTYKKFDKKWDLGGTKDLFLSHGKSGVRWFSGDDEHFAHSYALKEGTMDWDMQSDPPPIIVLKRKAIRVFPKEKKVALYYSEVLGRFISIPYGKDTLVTEDKD